jgi:hypothetical protein
MVVDAFTPFEITDGLVGWWKFDEGSGSTATDASGNSNNLTLYNTDPEDWVAGLNGSGYALDFDQTNEYGLATDSTSLDLDEFTIGVRIKKTSSTDYAGIVTKSDASSVTGYNYSIREHASGKIEASFYVSSTPYSVISTQALSTGVSYYLFAVHDGSYLRLYVDCVETGTAVSVPGSPNTGSRDVYVGIAFRVGTPDTGRAFDGVIDNIRLYNRALNASERASVCSGD